MAHIDDIVAHHTDATERYELAAQIAANARRRFNYAAAQEAELKRCPKCQEDKPASSFGRDSSRADGVAVYCRGCRRL